MCVCTLCVYTCAHVRAHLHVGTLLDIEAGVAAQRTKSDESSEAVEYRERKKKNS